MEILFGVLVAALGGSFAGALGWPMKLMKRYTFPHVWFPAMLMGLIIFPWVITLLFCPNAIEGIATVDKSIILKSNIFSLAWGIGNILLGLSLLRIGASLSFAILSGIGIPLGVIVPMIFKGSGMFQQAPDIDSPAGTIIIIATFLMLIAVFFVAVAGYGRDKMLTDKTRRSGSFTGGLIMCIISGICSVGPSFAFVYSQDPIREAMISRGASEWPASIAVYAVGMLFGSLVNVIYPAVVMSREKSWAVLGSSSKEFGLSLIVGLNLFLAFALWYSGMLLLGPAGASVGFGIYFALQILAAQVLGRISGEWKGVKGRPVLFMLIAVVILIVASVLMAYVSVLS